MGRNSKPNCVLQFWHKCETKAGPIVRPSVLTLVWHHTYPQCTTIWWHSKCPNSPCKCTGDSELIMHDSCIHAHCLWNGTVLYSKEVAKLITYTRMLYVYEAWDHGIGTMKINLGFWQAVHNSMWFYTCTHTRNFKWCYLGWRISVVLEVRRKFLSQVTHQKTRRSKYS